MEEGDCLSVGKGITVFFCIAFGSFSLGQAAPLLNAIAKATQSIRIVVEMCSRKSRIPIIVSRKRGVSIIQHRAANPKL